MTYVRKRIATDVLRLLFAAALLLYGVSAHAASIVGAVTHLSGPLLAKRIDGTARILAVKSSVEQGDTLISEKNTYARIKFIDNSEITLRPGTQLKIDSFVFDEATKASDSAVFSLIKGGLRAVTGALGKRSNERVSVNTPVATIGIRGTTFVAEYVAPDAESLAAYGRASVAALNADFMPIEPLQLAQIQGGPPRLPTGSGLAPGLHVFVLDGMIQLNNTGGSQNFSSGQFGFVRNNITPPIIVPNNPGLKFTPPPVFNMTNAGGGSGSANNASPDTVDCEVR